MSRIQGTKKDREDCDYVERKDPYQRDIEKVQKSEGFTWFISTEGDTIAGKSDFRGDFIFYDDDEEPMQDSETSDDLSDEGYPSDEDYFSYD